ncbi:hypothetical protein [Nocardia pseudovaccinii]|uniref:hypothetical protein n=1 Tax=Nocardia pseudovaccinii TaxID=189540 RepID=UPI0014718A5C|nr:hypothetical protein [Nocardia pseudovaccinii]
MSATPGLAECGTLDLGYIEVPEFGLADGARPEDVRFELGYDEEGIAAWPTFKQLLDQGVIRTGTKFQIAIPTALAVVGVFIRAEDRSTLVPEYEKRLAVEIANIAEKLPTDDIALQWDVAVEFGLLEGAFGPMPLPKEVILDEIVRMSSYVPESIEMGYHLCYGSAPTGADGRGRHFVEPGDTSLLVEVANAISQRAVRPISWIHLPVPIARDDDAYFQPLDRLLLRPETTLYLGLLHEQDGAEGAQRRIATAARHVSDFGVGTECGMLSEPRDRIPYLLRLHRDVSVPEPARP